jgi:hypothetical protein
MKFSSSNNNIRVKIAPQNRDFLRFPGDACTISADEPLTAIAKIISVKIMIVMILFVGTEALQCRTKVE